MRKQRMVRVMAWAVVCVSAGQVMGQTATWSGLGATNDWGDVGNWVEGVVPGNLVFPSQGNWQLVFGDSPRTEVALNDFTRYFNTLTSNSSSNYVISGVNALVPLSADGYSPPPAAIYPGITVAGSGSLTIGCPVTVGGPRNLEVVAQNGDLNIAGSLYLSAQGGSLAVTASEGRRVAITGEISLGSQFGSPVPMHAMSGHLYFAPSAVASIFALQLYSYGGSKIEIGSSNLSSSVSLDAQPGGMIEISAPNTIGVLSADGARIRVNQNTISSYVVLRGGSIAELNADLVSPSTVELFGSTVTGTGKLSTFQLNLSGRSRVSAPINASTIRASELDVIDGPLLQSTVTVTATGTSTLPVVFGSGTQGSLATNLTLTSLDPTGPRFRFLEGSSPVVPGGQIRVQHTQQPFGFYQPALITDSVLVAPVALQLDGFPTHIQPIGSATRIASSTVDVNSIHTGFNQAGGNVQIEDSVVRAGLFSQVAASALVVQNSSITVQTGTFSGTSLTLTNSSLLANSASLAGVVAVGSGSTVSVGSMSVTGTVSVTGASVVSVGAGSVANGMTVSGGSTVTFTSGTVAGPLQVTNSYFGQSTGSYTGVLQARQGSVVSLDTAALSSVFGSPLVVDGGSLLSVRNGTLQNSTISNQSQMSVGTVSQTGNMSIGGGSTVSFTSGSVIGTVTLTASTLAVGSVTNRGRINGDAASLLNGTLNNDAQGTVSFAGTFTGTLINRGNYDQAGVGNLVGTYVHEGTATLSGSPSVSGLYVINGPLTLTSGRVVGTRTTADLVNNSVVTLGLGGGVSLGGGTFTNNQTFSGQGVVTSTKVLNRGTVTISSNQLALRSGSRLDNLAGSVTLGSAGELNLDVTSLVTSAATFNISGGRITGEGRFVNNPGGRLSGQGLVDVEFQNGGEVSPVGGTLTIGRAFSSNGTIRLTVDGVLAGGLVTNTGRVYGDGIVSSELVNAAGGRIDPTGTISVARPLVNAGTLLLRNGGTLVTLGGFVGGVNGGTISLAGGQFDGNTSPVVNTGLVSGYGGVVTVGFTNAGAVSLAGGTTLWNGPVVNNAGRTVRVEFGTALFNGAFTNNGNVVVGTGGAVVFAGGSGGTGGGLGEGGSAAVVGAGRMQVLGGAGVELDGIVQGRLEVAGDVVMRSRQDEAGVQVRGASVSRVGVVSITGQGFVDLVDNDLVVTGMSVGSVREMVRTWLRGGVGGGPGEVGLGSSVAFYTEAGAFATLGVYDNSVAGQTMGTFGGVAVGAGDVLVKYTYVGDANLDGVVDATDLARVIAGMNGQGGAGGGWNFGDVNYDGVVNAVDLGRTMAALRGQGERLGGGMAGGGGGVIPEPGVVGVLGVVAMGMGRGRRR